MRKFLTVFISLGLLFASGPLGPSGSVASTVSEYQAVPPFVSAGVPPLVMLVMGRNHKLYYEAYNDASDLNGDGALDVGYNPDIDYYGYFDSHKCYVYSSVNSRFEPTTITADKKCSAADAWSGDFLNYLSMSRMDCLRKVLYGGYRSTDTAAETVLERVYIPQDAHSWGKEYENIARDGYDIREYTPLDLPDGPTGATRHLFVNTTLSEAGNPLLRVLEDSVYRIWDWVACEVPVAGDRVINGQTGPLVTDNGSASGFDVTEGGSAGTITDAGFGCPSTEEPSKAFDDSTNTKWLTWGASTSVAWQDIWIQFQFNSPKKILKYTITTGNDAEGRDPKAWKLQASNDGTVWTDIDTVEDGALPSTRKTKKEFICDSPPSESYIYYRLYITEKKDMINTDCGGFWCVQITEIEMMETTESVPSTATLTDYHVRVKVCDPSMPESNTKMYPSGVYKPVGILQRHGELDRMYFGLITGSYSKNTSGGVLRKNISSITDEIDSNTGQFTSTNGIIKTIDALRVIGFDYGSHSYNQNCGWITTRPINEGECRMWGNPIGEMMYEGMRYFAGKGTATPDFDYSTGDDVTLGLPKPTWQDPYDPNSGFFYCAKPFMLVLSDINPTYDSDQLPGSYFGSFTGDLTGLDVNDLANTLCTEENDAGSHFIGQSDSNYDGTCSEKDITGFGGVRGLCPEEPTKQGSYYAASVAYFGHKEDLSDANGSQNVDTYAVGLASPLPRINISIPVGDDNKTITLVPFAKSVGNYGISAAEGDFQPTNTIVDFFVESINATAGTFRINFEDVEQGADHDMDAIVEYEYQVNGTSVDITLNSLYSAGSIIQHIGYIISGTTADGTYLEVRDYDTSSGSDPDYFLDTPPGQGPGGTWNDSVALPLNTTRTFTPGDSPAATLLENPLWYAAKWGGFEDRNNNDIPDLESEWDNDADGVPDTYFYVTNPLELEEQLNRSFAEMLNRVSSGSAASVISSSRSGEGAIYQSIFFPELGDDEGKTALWVGNTHSLFVDDYGNMREDTNENDTLELDADYIIEFEGETGKARRYGYNSTSETKTFIDECKITEIKFVWDALCRLSDPGMDVLTQRNYGSNDGKRYIFTDYINTSDNVSSDNVNNNQTMPFTPDFANDPSHDNYYFLNPYLTYDHDSNPTTPAIGLTEDEMIAEAQKIIRFIRGEEGLSETGTGRVYRNRTLNIDGNDTVYRIGDIIYSTPTVVSKPSENYDLLYRDGSYRVFRKKYLNRRIVVYVGANDGMFHAFNSGFYDAKDHKFNTQPNIWDSNSSSFIPDTSYTDYALGSELWAYVPNALLPHLKWLTKLSSYNTHVYYVDLKPRIFDARIFYQEDGITPLDDDHPGGWGTVLIGGMRLGGKDIGVDTTTDVNGDPAPDGTCDLHFRSTYFALDVTNPEVAPKLLWSFSDDNLGLTTCYSTPIRVGDKWFVIIGSGPVDYEATRKDNGVNLTEYGGSNRTASLYILNADDGTLAKEFSGDGHSFLADPIAVDFDLATTVDGNGDLLWTGEAIYIASDGCGA
jgi:type IV pilus assembly protein PilY1